MIDRAKKWAAKLSGDNRKRLYDAQKEQMVKLETIASADMEKIELKVKQMVQGCPALYLPYYIIFGKEIYKRQNKLKGETLTTELEILDNKWYQRGLDEDLLIKIKHFYVPIYPECIPFRLNISLLDGPHCLS